MSMNPSARTTRPIRLAATTALLCVLSAMGCSRSAITLPPLVDAQGAPELPGKFVWHNLITSDGEAARGFYGGLLGWEFDIKDDGRYSVITFQGRNLGGILDASKDGNAPKRAHWLSAM